MAEITASMVKELREKTDAPMMDCKKALSEAGGDMQKAEEILRVRFGNKAAKSAGRVAAEGVVAIAISADGKSAAMLEVNCETDFVAKTDEFKEFAKNIAMHIAASSPLGVVPEDIPADVAEREREIYRQQVLEMGKPENVAEKIVDGKMNKFYKESCLMNQLYIRDTNLTISDVLNEMIAKTGEKITINRFARFQIGES